MPNRVPVYDLNGRIVAMVDATRAKWMTWLLAECPQGHVFIFDDGSDDECPICFPLDTDDRQGD